MRRSAVALVVFFVLLLMVVVHMAFYYPLLPERMASHFDLQGNPDSWSSKPTFFAVYAGMLFGVAGLLLGVGLAMRWIPVSLVNLPNKDYWLAPQRKSESLALVRCYLLWMTNATIALLAGCVHLTFRANLVRDPDLGPALMVIIGLYLVFTLVWCIGLFWQFRKPTQTINRID